MPVPWILWWYFGHLFGTQEFLPPSTELPMEYTSSSVTGDYTSMGFLIADVDNAGGKGVFKMNVTLYMEGAQMLCFFKFHSNLYNNVLMLYIYSLFMWSLVGWFCKKDAVRSSLRVKSMYCFQSLLQYGGSWYLTLLEEWLAYVGAVLVWVLRKLKKSLRIDRFTLVGCRGDQYFVAIGGSLASPEYIYI